jgi:hypothetical protein
MCKRTDQLRHLQSAGSSQLEVNLIIGDTDVTALSFDLVCDGGFTLSGQFNVNDEQDPPVWSVITDVPVGDCSLTLTAFDEQGDPLCVGGPKDFTVVEGETVKVNMVLACDDDGGDPLGNVEVDATFEDVEANNCPRLHLLNAVPDEVPAEGTAVTVLVSDKDGDDLTTALTATGGSFADPTAQSTTYTCDDASGSQTMFVTVSDGETACDQSTSFEVECAAFELRPLPDIYTTGNAINYSPYRAEGPEVQPSEIPSDYNNADHGNGVLIETNVFQEPFSPGSPITAAEVGKTFTFSFQAKGGNVEGSTTANAFIKTLDPGDGFSVSASDTQDTTNLPDTWGGFTVSLAIDASQIGHILQFGFQTNATNFEGSANFYDNVVLTTAPTP